MPTLIHASDHVRGKMSVISVHTTTLPSAHSILQVDALLSLSSSRLTTFRSGLSFLGFADYQLSPYHKSMNFQIIASRTPGMAQEPSIEIAQEPSIEIAQT